MISKTISSKIKLERQVMPLALVLVGKLFMLVITKNKNNKMNYSLMVVINKMSKISINQEPTQDKQMLTLRLKFTGTKTLKITFKETKWKI
jgi:hypothetical protein